MGERVLGGESNIQTTRGASREVMGGKVIAAAPPGGRGGAAATRGVDILSPTRLRAVGGKGIGVGTGVEFQQRAMGEDVSRLFNTLLPLLREDPASTVVWWSMKELSLGFARQCIVANREGQQVKSHFQPANQLNLMLGYLGGRNPVLLAMVADLVSGLIKVENEDIVGGSSASGRVSKDEEGRGLPVVDAKAEVATVVHGVAAAVTSSGSLPCGGRGGVLLDLLAALEGTEDEHITLDLLGVLGAATVVGAAARAATGAGLRGVSARDALRQVVGWIESFVVYSGGRDGASVSVVLGATCVLARYALAVFREVWIQSENMGSEESGGNDAAINRDGRWEGEGERLEELFCVAESAAKAFFMSDAVRLWLLGGNGSQAVSMTLESGVCNRSTGSRGCFRMLKQTLPLLRALAAAHPGSRRVVMARAVEGLARLPPNSAVATQLAVLLSHVSRTRTLTAEGINNNSNSGDDGGGGGQEETKEGLVVPGDSFDSFDVGTEGVNVGDDSTVLNEETGEVKGRQFSSEADITSADSSADNMWQMLFGCRFAEANPQAAVALAVALMRYHQGTTADQAQLSNKLSLVMGGDSSGDGKGKLVQDPWFQFVLCREAMLHGFYRPAVVGLVQLRGVGAGAGPQVWAWTGVLVRVAAAEMFYSRSSDQVAAHACASHEMRLAVEGLALLLPPGGGKQSWSDSGISSYFDDPVPRVYAEAFSFQRSFLEARSELLQLLGASWAMCQDLSVARNVRFARHTRKEARSKR
ncbi:unnamed protein product, partial [Choristocarpus tenellus]